MKEKTNNQISPVACTIEIDPRYQIQQCLADKGDNCRYSIGCALVEGDGSGDGVMVATDGRMMAVVPIKINLNGRTLVSGDTIRGADEAFGVEPDARKYKCESCGARAVYGVPELLMMGRINVTGE